MTSVQVLEGALHGAAHGVYVSDCSCGDSQKRTKARDDATHVCCVNQVCTCGAVMMHNVLDLVGLNRSQSPDDAVKVLIRRHVQ